MGISQLRPGATLLRGLPSSIYIYGASSFVHEAELAKTEATKYLGLLKPRKESKMASLFWKPMGTGVGGSITGNKKPIHDPETEMIEFILCLTASSKRPGFLHSCRGTPAAHHWNYIPQESHTQWIPQGNTRATFWMKKKGDPLLHVGRDGT